MSEHIDAKLQYAIVTLAEELSYPRAAVKLNTSPAKLRTQISEFEKLLCLQVFRLGQKDVELTLEGETFVRICRDCLSSLNTPNKDGRSGTQN